MSDIIFDNFEKGANDRLSPRVLGKYTAGGSYSGPYPVMHNVDRTAGTLKPRAGETLLNCTLPGEVLGMLSRKGFQDDTQYPVGTYPEILIVAVKLNAGFTRIGRVVTTAANPRFDDLALLQGSGPCEFVDLGTHVLAFNGTDAVVIVCSNDYPSGTWTVSSSGSPRSVTVSGTAYQYTTERWNQAKVLLKFGTIWYGPYKIQGVGDNAVTLAGIGYTGSTLTYDGPSGAADDVIIYVSYHPADSMSQKEEIPKTALIGTAGAGSGNLSGEYQYCYTFGTSDGFESNPTNWSDLVTADEQNVNVWNIGGFWVTPGTCNVDRRHIYRRGGSLGSKAYRIGTVFLDAAYLGGTKYFATLASTVTGGDATITVNEDISSWPTAGSFILMGARIICYTGINGKQFTGCTWVSYIPAETHAAGTSLNLDCFIDNVADSSVDGDELRTDRGWLPAAPLAAVLSGDRLYAVCPDDPDNVVYQSRVYISSIESWRYFSQKNAAEVADLDDDYTGGYRDMGLDREPVLALASPQSSIVIAYKRTQPFVISGRALWSMSVQGLNSGGTDAPRSVIVRDGAVTWKDGSHYWLWDCVNSPIDLADPLRSTMSGISSTYGSNAVGFYFDRRFYLFYPTDANGNKQYIEWDLRSLTEYEGGQAGPSPVTGDGITVSCATVGTNLTSDGIVYAAKGAEIWLILGTGSTRYAYGQGGGNMRLQLPDVRMDGGIGDAILEMFAVLLWAEGSVPAGTMHTARRFDSQAAAEVDYTLDATTDSKIQSFHKHPIADKRGMHIGLSLSMSLAEMASGSSVRSIESVAMEIKHDRKKATS